MTAEIVACSKSMQVSILHRNRASVGLGCFYCMLRDRTGPFGTSFMQLLNRFDGFISVTLGEPIEQLH